MLSKFHRQTKDLLNRCWTQCLMHPWDKLWFQTINISQNIFGKKQNFSFTQNRIHNSFPTYLDLVELWIGCSSYLKIRWNSIHFPETYYILLHFCYILASSIQCMSIFLFSKLVEKINWKSIKLTWKCHKWSSQSDEYADPMSKHSDCPV